MNTEIKISEDQTKRAGEAFRFKTGEVGGAMIKNIYDLAGNEREWTLEKAPSSTEPCVYRGGGSSNKGSGYPVIGQSNYNIVYDSDGIGFRVTMYAE